MEFQIRRSANILVAMILQKTTFLIGHFASALGSAYVIRNGNEQWGWNCSGNETAIEITVYVELCGTTMVMNFNGKQTNGTTI